MKRIILFTILSFVGSASAFAQTKYVLVGFSGLGGKSSHVSPAYLDLKKDDYTNISQIIKFYHTTKLDEINKVVALFNCKDGVKKNKKLKLIVVANSWGAQAASNLSETYRAHCGEKIAAFIMIDGITKPLDPFKQQIVADYCLNIYQTKAAAHGGEIKGCKSLDYTPLCKQSLGGGIGGCHVSMNAFAWIFSTYVVSNRYLKPTHPEADELLNTANWNYLKYFFEAERLNELQMD